MDLTRFRGLGCALALAACAGCAGEALTTDGAAGSGGGGGGGGGDASADVGMPKLPLPAETCGGLFAGEPQGAPASMVLYPLPGSYHPKSFNRMNVQFDSPVTDYQYRLRLQATKVSLAFCFHRTDLDCTGSRCQFHVPEATWAAAMSQVAGSDLYLTVDVRGQSETSYRASAPVPITVSSEDFAGKLYYFSTSTQGILRANDVNSLGAPLIVPNTKSNPKDCAGCHDVSLDGTKIAATYGHGDDFLGVASTADATSFITPVGTQYSNFKVFSPDGTMLLDNFNGALQLRSAQGGAVIATVPVTGRAIMPDWAHAGDRIAFVRLVAKSKLFYDVATCCARKPGGDWLATDAGQIVTMKVSGTSFSDEKVIVDVTADRFHFYPVFSPDDQWIVFDTGTKPGFSPVAQDSAAGFSYGVPKDLMVTYDQQTARLQVVRSTGGTPIDLGRANVGTGLSQSMPRVAPFPHRGGKLFFVTFSSKMDYGVAVTTGRSLQLWMTAIDTTKLAAGTDGSYAPIWLPQQDETETNHLGIWRP